MLNSNACNYRGSMKYTNGILRSFFGRRVSLETKQENLQIFGYHKIIQIDYVDIIDISIISGLVSDVIKIYTTTGMNEIPSLSSNKANTIKDDIVESTKKQISKIINKEKSLNKISSSIHALLNIEKYIAQSDIRYLLNKLPDIGQYLSHPFFDISYLNKDARKSLSILKDLQSGDSSYLIQKNEEFIKRYQIKYSDLFNTIEKYPLSDEQVRACLVDEDRNLIVAAAGSGKTSTIIAKVVYIITSKLAKPEEILVLAYNKAVQIELKKRLGEVSKKVSIPKAPSNIMTYHGFGIDVISSCANKKSAVSEFATASKLRANVLFKNLIRDLCDENDDFHKKWQEYISIANSPLPDYKDIDDEESYTLLLKQYGAKYSSINKSKTLVFPTLNNAEVKSIEELRIYNWLILNGVNFQYEVRYEHDTATRDYRQYFPDFYYPDVKLYHEHFALNSEGQPPKFMENYLPGVEWKRALHKNYSTKCIESYSFEFNNGDVFKNLEENLKKNGVEFSPLSAKDIDELIAKSFDLSPYIEVFVVFLKHFKSNNLKPEELDEIFKSCRDSYRAKLFLSLFKTIYEDYQNRLNIAGEIDFEDQINIATSFIDKNQYSHNFKYILVDEFQDISQDKMGLIKGLLSRDDTIKLFAVGDDWQSIYKFSGADIDIMRNFESHFGATSLNQLTQTYRNHQGITNASSEFIQKNPYQFKKNVKAKNHVKAKQINIYEYRHKKEHDKQLNILIEKINKKANKLNTIFSILILARYNHQLPDNEVLNIENYKSLEITRRSIHASKGLEADYVFLCQISSGTYGFPSVRQNDPMIDLLIPRSEDYPFAEERRVFYVAMTRTSRIFFILSEKDNESIFVDEIKKYAQLNSLTHIKNTDHPNYIRKINSKCPKCGTGKMIVKTDRKGLNKPFLGCSSFPKCKHTCADVICQKCNSGKLIRRVNKKTSDVFYPCDNFNCKYIHR